MSRILLIEDDLPLRRALRIILENSNHEVFEASDGREGIKLAGTQTLDLVVNDIIMPGMEGIETIQALRTLIPTLPILAISGGGRSSPIDYLKIAINLGATRSLVKPFEMDDFCAVVADLLNGE